MTHGKEIFLHGENGILGVGPKPQRGQEDLDLISAGKGHCTLITGACLFDQSISFTMMRGGHLTHAVMGAIEVAANGDFANWRVPGQAVPGVGGAMDLAVGAPNLFIAMSYVTNKGKPKIVNRCAAPLTAHGCVKRIYTDLAVIDVGNRQLRPARGIAWDRAPTTFETKTEAQLKLRRVAARSTCRKTFKGVELRR